MYRALWTQSFGSRASPDGIVFHVTGNSGSGKSTALEHLAYRCGIPAASKFTTHVPRHDQIALGPGDSTRVSAEEFAALLARPDAIAYWFGDMQKVVLLNEVRALLACYGSACMISGHRHVAERLEVDLAPVPIRRLYLNTDLAVIESRLRAKGYTDKQLTDRLERSHQNREHYLEEPHKYIVIDNNTDRSSLEDQLTAVVRRFCPHVRVA